MNLYVLMREGAPFQLPEADAETANRLMDLDDEVSAQYAFASTERRYVEAMRKVLPDLLDWDDDGGLYIAYYECTKYNA